MLAGQLPKSAVPFQWCWQNGLFLIVSWGTHSVINTGRKLRVYFLIWHRSITAPKLPPLLVERGPGFPSTLKLVGEVVKGNSSILKSTILPWKTITLFLNKEGWGNPPQLHSIVYQLQYMVSSLPKSMISSDWPQSLLLLNNIPPRLWLEQYSPFPEEGLHSLCFYLFPSLMRPPFHSPYIDLNFPLKQVIIKWSQYNSIRPDFVWISNFLETTCPSLFHY